jgi:hypothetical protein
MKHTTRVMMEIVRQVFQQQMTKIVAKNSLKPIFSPFVSIILVKMDKINPIPAKIEIAKIIMWVFYKGKTSCLIKKL